MPRLTVLMGAPGAGKSTYAKSTGATVVTTDGGRERGQKPGDTLHNAYRQIHSALAAGKDVVFDTTGANPKVRKAAATIAAQYGAQLNARVMDTPVAQCVQAQQSRPNPVASATVKRIHDAVRKQTAGLQGEGFTNVGIVRNRR
jgi:predicted kinase